MRWILVVLLPLAALSMLGAAPVPTHLMPKDEPFWPAAVGTKWVYEDSGKQKTQEITKAEAIKGGTRLTIQGGDMVLDVCRDGVTHRSSSGQAIDALLIRLPAKAGDTWTVAPPPGSEAPWWRMTVGETEEVKVPAGTFRAVKVTITETGPDGAALKQPLTYTHWFAPGVGTVRWESVAGERVLKAFTPGK